MKKTILFIALAAALTGCFGKGGEIKPVEQKESEKVANAKWDYYVVGSWKYTQTTDEGATADKYVEGIETFMGNGDYVNHCMTADSSRVVLKGFWAVDSEKDYTIKVYLQTKSTDKGEGQIDHQIDYTLVSLEPGVEFNYTFNGNNRRGFYVADK